MDLQMLKAEVIARGLAKASDTPIESARLFVRQVFDDEFPLSNFDEWNRDLDRKLSRRIIETLGDAATIAVHFMIEDLDYDGVLRDQSPRDR